MAATLAKQAVSAFTREKPHSSITDWVEILTSTRYDIDTYDGIPELVDSINIQGAEGTTEGSRAIRKKLKHGNTHQQLRALVILKALVENCGSHFQSHFADDRLIDAIRQLANDFNTDPAVRKKLLVIFASWKRQFEEDAKMRTVTSLYDEYKRGPKKQLFLPEEILNFELSKQRERESAKRDKEEAKKRRKEKEEERQRQRAERSKRKPFDFEVERPKVLEGIVTASQASSNLVNALKLVNREKEPVETNERVQECLTAAKTARKQIVKYIQLVENEEIIGTLLETNEHIINALELYDQHLIPDIDTSIENQLARTKLSESNVSLSEVTKLQEKQKAAVARAQAERDRELGSSSSSQVHPDLQDLVDFNSPPQRLQASLTPLTPDSEDEEFPGRGSLSDFSDYKSSDEETHNRTIQRARSVSPEDKGKSYKAFYRQEPASEDGLAREALLDDSDPFADPSEAGKQGTPQVKESW